MKPPQIAGLAVKEKKEMVALYADEQSKMWERIASKSGRIWSKSRQKDYGLEDRGEYIDHLKMVVPMWAEEFSATQKPGGFD